MADVIYLWVFAAFFALAALFVRACEAIIGPDQQAAPETDRAEPEQLAA